MGEKDNEMKNLSKDQHDLLKEEKSSADEFLRSAAYAALHMPYEGAAQLVNKMSSSQFLPDTRFAQPDAVEPGSRRWYAQTLGTAAGALPWIVAIGKGVQVAANPFISRLEGDAVQFAGMKMSSSTLATGEAALTGGIYSGLLQPSRDLNNFWAERGTNATIGALTLGTFGYGMSKFNLDSASHLTRMGAGGLLGTVAGFVNAESNALLKERRLATDSEISMSMLNYGIVGTAMVGLAKPETIARAEQVARNVESVEAVKGFENAPLKVAEFNKLLAESHKMIDSGKSAEAGTTLDNLSTGLGARSLKNAVTADEYMQLGSAFRRLGNDYTTQARSSFNEAMDIYQNGGARAQAADAAHRLSMLEESSGNYGKAADWLDSSLRMKADAAGKGLLNRAEAAEFRQTQNGLYDKLENLYRKAGNEELADKVQQSRPAPEAPVDYHRVPGADKK